MVIGHELTHSFDNRGMASFNLLMKSLNVCLFCCYHLLEELQSDCDEIRHILARFLPNFQFIVTSAVLCIA